MISTLPNNAPINDLLRNLHTPVTELGLTSDGRYVGLQLTPARLYELIFPNPRTALALLMMSDDWIYDAVRGVI